MIKSVATCGMVCSRQIDIVIDGDILRAVRYTGGCNGNTTGVAALVAGMKVKDVISRLDGIDCGRRGTSCPEQLSSAINTRCLHVRKDGQPVKTFNSTLTYAEWRIFLMI